MAILKNPFLLNPSGTYRKISKMEGTSFSSRRQLQRGARETGYNAGCQGYSPSFLHFLFVVFGSGVSEGQGSLSFKFMAHEID